MKKFLGILVLGLLLNGCTDQFGSRPFGSTPQDLGRVLEANEHFIKIVFSRSVYGSGTNNSSGPYDELTIPQIIAKKHCAKYKKYAHFFGYDFDSEGAYYRCYQDYKSINVSGNKKVEWSSYPDKIWEIKKIPKKIAKKSDVDIAKETCIEIGYQSNDEEFKTCVLTVMKIGVDKKIYSQKGLVDTAQNYTSYKSWEILEKLDKAENQRRMNRQLKFACSLMSTCPKN